MLSNLHDPVVCLARGSALTSAGQRAVVAARAVEGGDEAVSDASSMREAEVVGIAGGKGLRHLEEADARCAARGADPGL